MAILSEEDEEIQKQQQKRPKPAATQKVQGRERAFHSQSAESDSHSAAPGTSFAKDSGSTPTQPTSEKLVVERPSLEAMLAEFIAQQEKVNMQLFAQFARFENQKGERIFSVIHARVG